MSEAQTENKTNAVATAPRTQQFSQALTLNGKEPSWNLKAEVVAYPLEVEGTNPETGEPALYKLGVYLNCYQARELKECLHAERQGFQQDIDGDFASMNRTWREFYPLLGKHFVGLDGVTSKDPDRQRQFVTSNPQLMTLMVRECWGGVRLWHQPTVADVPFDIDSIHDAPIPISTVQKLWSSEGEANVRMTHHFKRPTQNQYSRYQSANRQKIGRRGMLVNEVNNDILEMLYNESAVKVDGMTLDGQACVEANRDQWIPLVPLWHKTLVIGELYRETRLKN